jgi:hypothetical protein
MPEQDKERTTEKSEGSAFAETASGPFAARGRLRRLALLILLLATSAMLAYQVLLDVTHLKRVSVELSNIESRMALHDIFRRDRKSMDELEEMDRKSEERNRELLDDLSKKPRTDGDMELRALSQEGERLNAFRREQSRLMDQQTEQTNDFLKSSYSDEEKYSRILILVDSVWLVFAAISAIAAFKRLACANMSARLFAGLTLLCALARVCASAAGTKDGYLNLLIWPLSVCSLGNSVFWRAAIMILWSVAVLCLSLKGSELREERRRL